MLTLRKAGDRGHARHGWLESFHTFSFAGYRDPAHMGFRDLRVINEDRVQPGRGFDTHSHHDMEIVTYVVEGALEHGDSLGNGSVIRPGDVQRMSAGTGITHSEYNHSGSELVHFLQIWILPERRGLEPSYEQRHFSRDERGGRLRLVASREAVSHELAPSRHAWVQVVSGEIELDATPLEAGDGAAVSDRERIDLAARSESEVLLFDLA
jgi:redox-sensitive bicupin YhaK (pirin superfamily)